MPRWSSVRLYSGANALLATYLAADFPSYYSVTPALEAAVRARAASENLTTLARLEFAAAGPVGVPTASTATTYTYNDIYPTYFDYVRNGRPVQAGLEVQWHTTSGSNVVSLPVEGVRALDLTADGRVANVISAANVAGAPTLVTTSYDRGNVDLALGTGNVTCGSVVSSGTISGGTGLMFRNRIINGDMRINQRGATSTVTGTGTSALYTPDRFVTAYHIVTGGLTHSIVTLSASDEPYQRGFLYSYRITASTAVTSYSYICPQQFVEAFQVTDFMWGTSFGVPVTVSLWVRTNLAAGSVLTVSLRNGYSSSSWWSYNAPITVVEAGKWQFATVVVPAPPSNSTWNMKTPASFNLTGVEVLVGAYQSTRTSAPNTWENNNYLGMESGTNPYASLNNYVEFTGVQLEKGSVATPFEFRPYPIELQLCQRYTYKYSADGSINDWAPFGHGRYYGTNAVQLFVKFPVTMRCPPSSMTASGSIFVNDLSFAGAPFTSIVLNEASQDGATVKGSTTTGVTAGYATTVYSHGSNVASMIFNAEF